MSKIVILSTGKLNSSLNGYARELSRATHRERIVILNSKKQLPYAGKYGVREVKGFLNVVLGDGWAINNLFGSLIFKKLARELDNNIIHYTTFGMPLLRKNRNDIVTIDDLFFLEKGDEAYRNFLNVPKILLDRFTNLKTVISPSEYTKRSLQEYGFNGNIEVIYRPAPEGFYHIDGKEGLRRKLGLPLDKTLVLSVSSSLKRKNLGVINKTVERLGENFRLVRVGSPVGNSINFSDVDQDKLNLIYNACDLLLFPTLNEGYGVPVVEAMVTGLPTVVSDIEIMREVSRDASVFVDPTVEGCYSGILSAADQAEILRSAGYKRAKYFTRESFDKRINSVYNKIESTY